MSTVTEAAPAKINLTLDVAGKRSDGYHDIVSVMQTVELSDRLTVSLREGGEIRVSSNRGYLPLDGRNTAYKAAKEFFSYTGLEPEGIDIHIEKSIPVCAGLGGGSADAAAVIRALPKLYGMRLTDRAMLDIALAVGSDVPFCVLGGTALARGRGEKLTRLKTLQGYTVVICKPPFGISTPELFTRIDSQKITARPDNRGMLLALENDDITEVSRRLFNVFEAVTERGGVISEIKSVLLDNGALGAAMSGTGPTVFGIFPDDKWGKKAYSALKSSYEDTFLTKTV